MVNAVFPEKLSAALIVNCVAPSALTDVSPAWAAGEDPSTSRGKRPDRTMT